MNTKHAIWLVPVVLVALALPSVRAEDKPAGSPAAPGTAPQSKPEAKPETPAAPAAKPADKTETPAKEQIVSVSMKTSMGEIVIELDAGKAPISVENFLKYVDKGQYNGTIFHRVISGFMIQGGGFDKEMNQKPTDKPIKNEWRNGLKNVRGAIAMARTSDPDSATCQFFINTVDNDFLDRPNGGAAYCVFGRVTSGMDVVDKIRKVKTGQRGPYGDVPTEPVVIESVTRVASESEKK